MRKMPIIFAVILGIHYKNIYSLHDRGFFGNIFIDNKTAIESGALMTYEQDGDVNDVKEAKGPAYNCLLHISTMKTNNK